MKRFAIALLGLAGLISARPAYLSVPLTYATLTHLPLATINGVSSSNPEVTIARTRIDEETNLANDDDEATTSRAQHPSTLVNVLTSVAPLGADGRVVDTAEVAAAKAAHAAAHANQRLNLANEAARSGASEMIILDDSVATTSETLLFGHDGGVGEIAHDRINPANEAARPAEVPTRFPTRVNDPLVPLLLGNGLVAALVPAGTNGGPLNTPEVIAREDQDLPNDLRSVDALAVAGPALAYGRLVY